MSVQSLNALSSRAIIGRYYATLENLGVPAWVDAISQEFPSNQDSETYKFLGQTPALREWVGGRMEKGLPVGSQAIKNVHYEATLNIDVSDIRRDKTGQIMIRVDDLARRTQNHWCTLLSSLIVNGHSSATCYDGQDFFDDDHSEGDSGTLQNDIDATDVPALNLTLGAPTAAEMAAALLDTIAYIHAYKDNQGEPINDDAREFIVMTGIPLFYGALLQACTLANVSGGQIMNNALVGGGFKVVPVYNGKLSAGTAQIWLFRTDGPVKPFIRQVETPVVMKTVGAGSENEFDNDTWKFGVDTWRGCGYGLWQYACRCTLS